MKMKVELEIYGKKETIKASSDFWLKFLTALNEAAEYNEKSGFKATAKEYDRLHNDIFQQTKKEILKNED